ncbi:MAG: oxygenase MpaB family protein [Acidimicrobiia bacterium]
MSIRVSTNNLVEGLRSRLIRSTTSPFMHAPFPLSNTFEYPDDPGLFGTGSISWAVLGDISALVGGIRGLLIQAAHPEVVAGVGDHSRYRQDPLGRLSRTSAYVTATTYGAMPEVKHVVEQVKRIHSFVSGVSSRGIPYDAADPGFSAWVHNALTDSFLTAHVEFGGIPLTSDEQNRFVLEQTKVGLLMGAEPTPSSRVELSRWIADHPDVAPSPEMRDAVDFLTNPPLETTIRVGYKVLLEAAIATIPPRLLGVLGLSPKPMATSVGRSAVSGLRWALGYSPSWRMALVRCGAPIPSGLFRVDERAA